MTQMTWQHAWLYSTQLGAVARGALKALAIGLVFYFILYLLERASGGTTHQYRTRGFLQDVAYWFYYQSGLHHLLFTAALFSFLSPKLAFLQLKTITGLNPIARGVLWFLVTDFVAYWFHRLEHASRFVWAFHSTHHSQEQLSFATTTRFHPVDHFIGETITRFPLLMLGASPTNWLPVALTQKFLTLSQHSQINWRLGVLSKVFVTPWFHSFHHSTDPRYYNKNFGAYTCIWDHLFGTAVDAPERPAEFGLREIKMPTLLSTLVVPFRLLRQTYSRVSPPAVDQVHGAIVISGSPEEPPNG